MIVKLSREQANQMIEEALKRHPIEACGGIFGRMEGEIARVERVVPLRNILESEIMFQIDPEEFLRVLLDLEGEGLTHLGFFHSHPGNARPSMLDLKYMRLWPESIWIIVSSVNYEFAAYQITDGNLREVYISIE
ncbi:MAG: M67 family metallopeptidase [Candidatus Bathyarchaeia archaeon]